MNIKTHRQRLLSILAIAVVALWAGDKLVLSPLTNSWKQRALQIDELRKSVAQGSLLAARDQSIRNRWDSMRTNTLPGATSVAENELLKAFERWSQESRVSITSIKPQWKRAGDDYMTLECRADAFGSMQALTRFLFEVEKDPLALKVEGVEINTRDNDGRQLTLSLQVSGLLLNPEDQ